jgi:hypothetical protein
MVTIAAGLPSDVSTSPEMLPFTVWAVTHVGRIVTKTKIMVSNENVRGIYFIAIINEGAKLFSTPNGMFHNREYRFTQTGKLCFSIQEVTTMTVNSNRFMRADSPNFAAFHLTFH